MKKSVLIIIIAVFLINAGANTPTTSSAHAGNTKTEIDTLLYNLQKENKELNARITSIENQAKKPDELLEKIILNVKNATILVEILAVLMGFAALIAALTIWDKIKEAKEKIKEFEVEATKKMSEFEKEIKNRIKHFDEESTEKMNEFEKEINDKRMQIDSTSKKIITVESNLEKMGKELQNSQVISEQGFQTMKDFFYTYMDRKNDTEFLRLLYKKTALVSLHSRDEKERFSGITTLITLGSLSDINYLYEIINNVEESKANKDLAITALAQITKRSEQK